MSVLSLLLAVTVFQRLLDQSTDALKTNVGLTGACNLNRPTLSKLNVGSTGACNLRNPQKWSFWTTAPTLQKPTSVQPVYSADLAFSESVAPVSTIFLSSVQPVILNCLYFDLFDLDFFTVSSILVLWTEEVSGRCPETREGRLPLDPRPRNPRRGGPSGLAAPIFSLSSLEPKSLGMFILTIILVQVLCVSSIAKTLY